MKKIIAIIFFVFLLQTTAYADYIVKLKPEAIVPADVALIEPIAEQLKIYRLPDELAYKLESDGLTEYIEKESRLVLIDDIPQIETMAEYNDLLYYTQKYFSLMGIDKLKDEVGRAENVRIAVIDTGVNKEHFDLSGAKIEEGYNYVKNNYDVTDLNNHGTRVLGVMAAKENNKIGIAGIIPNANFVPLLVLSGNESSDSYLINAIVDAVDKYDCKVINISIGSLTKGRGVQDAIDYANGKGAIVVASAGNKGDDAQYANHLYYPASCDNVISVGSVNNSFKTSKFSQKNYAVDVSGVGEGIYSTSNDNKISYGNGTSFSTPIISGIIGLLVAEHPNLTHDDMMYIIKACSIDNDESGKDYAGYGVLMADECLLYIKSNESIYISPVCTIDDLSYNIKLTTDLESATLVVARYKSNVLIEFDIKQIDFFDNVYCTNILAKDYDDEIIKIFLVSDIDSLRSLSQTKII